MYANILQLIREASGIQAAGTINALPVTRRFLAVAFSVEGGGSFPGPEGPTATEYQVMPGYFEAMGIRLLDGRTFSDLDVEGAPEVAIVNETMARLHFDGDAVGGRVRLANSEGEELRQVVGVVGDVRTGTLTSEPPPQVYLPFPQLDNPVGGTVLVVRASNPAVPVPDVIRSAVRDVRPDLALSTVHPLAVDISDALARERLVTLLLTTFAVLALGLATLGIYGVVAYSAMQRSHEMGVRMMLGAEPAHVHRLVVGLGARLATLGIAAGLVASFAATRLLRSLLYEVSELDPVTFVAVPLVLGLMATLAAYVPARRVTASDPLTTLRSE